MAVYVREFLKQTEKGFPHPAYLFAGKEEYFIREARKRLMERLRAKGNEIQPKFFSSEEAQDFSRLTGEARTVSLWAQKEVFIVETDSKLAKKDIEPLEAYLKAPSSSTILVFEWRDIDERLKLATLLKKHAFTVSCAPPKGRALKIWLNEYAETSGARFAPGVAEFLLDMVGDNLMLLSQEVDKSALFAEKGKLVTKDVFEQLGASTRKFALYDFIDALLRRDQDTALRTLKRLFDMGERPYGVINGIAAHIRKVLRARVFYDMGNREEEILKKVGVYYYTEKFLAQIKAFKQNQLERILEECFEVDRALKTSAYPESVIFERFVVKLAKSSDAESRW